ncbi:hypothetical protein KIM67_16985 [Flagellimonas sp. 389]|uniref:peptidoglycan amidohydrolase family protein n=1 Tax=Flagellimonas sp. 389 TaxID=2835862 RepID=UPI001BD2A256|nr:peptidoglycan amidohydrolase family protein [Flagellimonas sp. 389]MBS9464120.1 hypothetical protein [Flagellimonas sp. 389]
MAFNKFTKIIPLLLLLVLTNCKEYGKSDKLYSLTSVPERGKDIIYILDQQFEDLWNIDQKASDFNDLAASINKDISTTIKKITTQSFLEEINRFNYLKKHSYVFALSDDKKIGVFSWNTRLGDSMGDFKSIVLHIKNDSVVHTYLNENSITYNEIYNIKINQQKPVYLFHGWGKSSDYEYYYQIDAFSNEEGIFQPESLFPDNKSSLTSHYQLENLDFEAQMDFSIEKDGSLILQPEIWGEKVVYHPLEFNDTDFERKHLGNKANVTYTNDSFERSNTFNFINGSEFPLVNDKVGHTTTFTFENELKVSIEQVINNTFSGISVSMYEADTIRITINDPAISLIGKKGNYLFFEGAGVVENWPIHIYDLSERTILTKYISAAIIKENKLIFKELVPNRIKNHNETVDCVKEYGEYAMLYRVYGFQYTNLNPVVESMDLILCGYEQ